MDNLAALSDRAKGALLLAAIVLVATGLAFLVLYPDAQSDSGGDRPPADTGSAGITAGAKVRPTSGDSASLTARPSTAVPPPASTTMTLSVPALERVRGVAVKTAHGSEDAPLRYGAMHVLGTGYPWQDGANTYIAGHRLGFPGTPSDRLFWDLDDLDDGDQVTLTDSEDRRYEYRVFRTQIVDPEDTSVARPVPGKAVVSLQTCTLPDYARRLVVQAELVQAPPSDRGEPGTPGGGQDAFGAAG